MNTTTTAHDPTEQRYRLGDVIGRGGMATVYRAFDEVAELDVAVKVLHEHLADDEGMVEAFEREAALMRAIDHEGVVDVFATTDIDGRPAIVMELCEGGDLSAQRARYGTFTEERAREIMGPIFEALDAIHAQGIIHRDIKPHNVIFDDRGNPKLIDFGIGQAEELMTVDEAGQVGTVEYMAPERIDGMAVDGRSDIYSAGVMFFELLCGHPPYRADTAAAVMRMHREAPVADPSTFADQISDETRRAVMGAMAKHPEERFDRAGQIIDLLHGDHEERRAIPQHPSWTAIKERFGQRFFMAAPIEDEGYEWVVYMPREAMEKGVDYDGEIRRLIGDYPQFFTLGGDQLSARHGAFGKGKKEDTGDVEHYLDLREGSDLLERFGIARGLSRQGVDQLVERLVDAGIMARYTRRPRTSRRESAWKRYLTRVSVLNSAVMLAFWAVMICVAALYLFGAQSSLMVAAFVAACGLAGILSGWISISDMFRQWWLTRISSGYLLDFSNNRQVLGAGELVGQEQFQALISIESPRLSASFERAMSMVLYLRDEVGDDAPVLESIVDQLTDLAGQISAAEMEVAAVRPGELASQIRRLDRHLESEDEISEIEALMERKSALRQRLTARDDAQQRLQALAQRLHELASRLEALVRRHRQEDISDDLQDLTTLDFEADEIRLELAADEDKTKESVQASVSATKA